jgi:hypothetical protein
MRWSQVALALYIHTIFIKIGTGVQTLLRGGYTYTPRGELISTIYFFYKKGAGMAQSVYRLATGWIAERSEFESP